jgi:hypothetical protein
VLSAIQNLLRVEVAMRLKKLSTAIGAEFRIAALRMRTRRLDTRRMSVRLLTQMPIRQGNSTGRVLSKRCAQLTQRRRLTGYRRSHTLRFKAGDPKKMSVSSR